QAISEVDLKWYDWVRYSNRQNTHMKMGGLVGEFVLDEPGFTELLPVMQMGELTHAGKACTMGLGHYSVT
ncbi:MAG: CRISPR system precrRNA processing endoribonuclease RAMP protein Cas6, partial [Pseudomonadota bacterium]